MGLRALAVGALLVAAPTLASAQSCGLDQHEGTLVWGSASQAWWSAGDAVSAWGVSAEGEVRSGRWGGSVRLRVDRFRASSTSAPSLALRGDVAPGGMLGMCVGLGGTISHAMGLAEGDRYTTVLVPLSLARSWTLPGDRIAVRLGTSVTFTSTDAALLGFSFREQGVAFGTVLTVVYPLGSVLLRADAEVSSFPADVGPHPVGDTRFALGLGWRL